MFVIAHHFISDPEKFWALTQQVMGTIPAHIKLHSVFPSKDLKTGTCIWEAPNANEVQTLLDQQLGNLSKNVCYEVNEEAALGLPQKMMAQVTA